MEKAANELPITSAKVNVVPIEIEDGASQLVHFIYAAEVTSDPGEPDSFDKAWNGPKKHLWRPSHVKELMNFTERGSWIKVPRQEAIDSGQSIVGTKVVFKKKDEPDGTVKCKSRVVSLGYSFVPGVDYDESYAPVAQDSSNCMLICIGLYHWRLGWTIIVINVSGASLEGSVNKPIYI